MGNNVGVLPIAFLGGVPSGSQCACVANKVINDEVAELLGGDERGHCEEEVGGIIGGGNWLVCYRVRRVGGFVGIGRRVGALPLGLRRSDSRWGHYLDLGFGVMCVILVLTILCVMLSGRDGRDWDETAGGDGAGLRTADGARAPSTENKLMLWYDTYSMAQVRAYVRA